MADRPVLRAISPTATDEEVAAIVAAIAAATASASAPPAEEQPASYWVSVARLAARRAPMARGQWRLSGRMPRRSRA
ncbi:MAG TPA: acyl-CoA carboxylase epsilon subunit [Acidimicrobiia bacterium]|jgi:hypothetical protein